ncbi:hypothetical protein IKF63_00970, partial [Candidatus Saccharibacteria bacterium]|nr:hypothetical protein [Candidatus Saccharibacteria bacterium]
KSGNTYTGDGIHTEFKFRRFYNIVRYNDDTSIDKATTRYGIATGNSYPSSLNKSFSLSKGESDSYEGTGSFTTSAGVNISGDKVTIPFGKSATICFNLAYDNEITYKDGGVESRKQSNPPKRECVTFNNPKKTSTATYSGVSFAALNQKTENNKNYLDLNNNKTVGEISHSVQDTNTGAWNDNVYPSNDTYTAHFVHKVSRLGLAGDYLKSNDSTTTLYKIQQQVNDGKWTDLTSFASVSFTSDTKTTVYNESSVDVAKLNSSNKGTVTKYCQKIVYKSVANYAPDISGVSYNGNEESTAACVTVKNPNFQYLSRPQWNSNDDSEMVSRRSDLTHTITVKGNTPEIDTVTGAKWSNRDGGEYLTEEITVTTKFSHTLSRTDSGIDYSWNNSKTYGSSNIFTASASQKYKLFPETGRMNDDTFAVSSWFGGLIGSSNCLVPTPNSGKCSLGNTNNLYGLTFKKGDPAWSSANDHGGYTQTTTDEIPAGTSKNICQSTYNLPSSWTVKYVDIGRKKVYYKDNNPTKGIDTTLSDSSYKYSHTKLKSSAPEVAEDSSNTSVPGCAKLFRDWNYKITSAKPTQEIKNNLTAGQSSAVSFTLPVVRDDGWNDDINRNYITDLNSKISTVLFVVNNDVSPEEANAIVTSGSTTVTDACVFYRGVTSLEDNYCEVVATNGKTADHNGTGVYSAENYSTTFTTPTFKIPIISVGAKLCVSIAIANYSSTSGSVNMLLSQPTCTSVSKNPSVQVWGGSVGSGGGISTSITETNTGDKNQIFGSWTDLSIVAYGSVNKFSSGDAIVAKRDVEHLAIPCDVSPLTIANSDCTSNKSSLVGNSGINLDSNTFERVYSRFSEVPKNYKNDSTTTLEITQDFFQNNGFGPIDDIYGNETIFIYSKGDIFIKDNIKLSDATYSTYRTAQVIIMSDRNIKIADNVTEADAWMIARGEFNSCVSGSGESMPLTADACTEPLKITGAVSAEKAALRRTNGADLKTGTLADSAEIFNYGTGIYLLGSNPSGRNGEPRTVYSKKLAPRY